MKSTKKLIYLLLIVGIFYFDSCKTENYQNVQNIERRPVISPEYIDVTIPPNIAPMNFNIKEVGSSFKVTVTSASHDFRFSIHSADGIVQFPKKAWRKLLDSSKGARIKIQVFSVSNDKKHQKKYRPIYMNIAEETIDPYLSYRLFFPGYSHWSKIEILQRSLENFDEEPIIENQALDNNCVNCHSFNQNDPNQFLLHIRGTKGGTYFVEDNKIIRTALKVNNMPGEATYPAWHPNGRYIAFSSNEVKQAFYAHPDKDHEVLDLTSSLVLYDRKNNEMLSIRENDTLEWMPTFPTWSPNGKNLYYCRARQFEENIIDVENIKQVHYDLVKKPFDPESRIFGETEIVFNAFERKKSVSFPKISPNGKYLVFTLHDYGTFPVWHKESDLHLLNLENGQDTRMDLNSNETESYHNWSTNGKWLVFSSKRGDGRTSRTFFAYFKSPDFTGKPFVLPQEDPTLYNRMLKSFNLPELITDKVSVNSRGFAHAAKENAIKAKPGKSH